VTLVRFSETLAGLKEAERLSELFEKSGQGRNNWTDVRKARDNNSSEKSMYTSDTNSNLVKEYESGERRVLYGYLGTASDLEIFDFDAKKRADVRSRKESDFPDK
jgi:XS domain